MGNRFASGASLRSLTLLLRVRLLALLPMLRVLLALLWLLNRGLGRLLRCRLLALRRRLL